MNPPMIWSSQWLTVCVILSSNAYNLRTNFEVQTIEPSSLHLPWASANFVIHSYNSTKKEQKNILYISVYIYLSNHCSFINHRFLFSYPVNSWIFLSNQSLISFLVGFQWSNITHIIIQISVSDMKPFVGLMGFDPGPLLSSQENPYTIGPFGIKSMEHGLKAHLKQYRVMQEPSFYTLRWYWCCFQTFTLPSCKSIIPLGIINVLLLFVLEAFTKVYDHPSRTLNR